MPETGGETPPEAAGGTPALRSAAVSAAGLRGVSPRVCQKVRCALACSDLFSALDNVPAFRKHQSRTRKTFMKTFALLLGVALSLATFTTSAAPFSSNAVGYVKVSVPTNQFALLGVPLSGTNNLLNTTMR